MIPKRFKHDPQRLQNDPKSSLKRVQDEAKRAKKANPKRQDKKRSKPRRSQDRLGLPGGGDHQFVRAAGAPFGTPTRHQNRSPNDQKSKRKSKRPKNAFKTILDPSWCDLGSCRGAVLGEKTPETVYFNWFREHILCRR